MVKKVTLGTKLCQALIWLVVTLMTLSCLLPLINMVAISLSSSNAVASNTVGLLPVELTFSTYEKLLNDSQFWASFWISVQRVVLGTLDQVINWGRSNSLWSLTFATSCCGIEFMAVGCARYDFARFGFEVTRNSPRQADLIMCAGTITHKMAPVFKRLYDEMADPKYVVAVGGCAISGGPFKDSYHVVRGISEIVPVDVYIPGCPPRPEAIMYGMMQLQRKVKIEKFFGGVNHKQTAEERREAMKPIVVTDVPKGFDPKDGRAE